MYYVVKYSGPFAFIKPWTAVRDTGGGETYSQQFLTPSIIEGIRQKLEVTKIIRHKLTYSTINLQQETVKAKTWKLSKGRYTMDSSILKRGVLINPYLYLAFEKEVDADKAHKQHICLCRNEDILLPSEDIMAVSEQEFNELYGYELRFGKGENSFLVGYDRFNNNSEMFGWLDIVGTPVKNAYNE